MKKKPKEYYTCKKEIFNRPNDKPSAIQGKSYQFPTEDGLLFINEFGEPHDVGEEFKKEHFII